MRSDKQLQASRANGAKSRGPATAAGKSISSRNSTRHAVLANTLTLEIELKDSFLDLAAKLHDEFQPQTPFEESLVESMAAARWRLWRIWSIESASLNLEVSRQTATEHCASRVALALKELSDQSRSLDLMSRYEVRYERQYLRCHRRLMEVRGQRIPPAPGPFLVPKPQTAPEPEPRTADAAPAPEQQRPAASLVFPEKVFPEKVFPEKLKSPNEPGEIAETRSLALTCRIGNHAGASAPQPETRSQPEEKNLNSIFSCP